MKRIQLLPVYITMSLIIGMNAFGQTNAKTAKKGFAVLELFTSEGCSSCPPADELMGKLQQEYKDDEVYILSYHVDYWDSQGWKDVYGNPDYTKRQYKYGEWLGTEPIYTPQVVVNGRTEHIGSQEGVVKAAIKKGLSIPEQIHLSLKATYTANGLIINYDTSSLSKNNRILFAVVQKAAQSRVKRGENGGRILSHYQIVKHLHSISITKGGKDSVKLPLPSNFNPKAFEVIGFVQDITNGAILGAARSAF